jgi:hypothetical protein
LNAKCRPILLLTVISKVFKTAMHSWLNQYLHSNNAFVPEQHAFRQGLQKLQHLDYEKCRQNLFVILYRTLNMSIMRYYQLNYISMAFKELLQTVSDHI